MGGNSSLTRQAELTAHCCFTGSLMHRQCWEYSSPHRSVIDPLRLLLMLDVTPSHPVSHWQHQLPASIIYYFLSACTWNKCTFKAAPMRSCCRSLIARTHMDPFVLAARWEYFIINSHSVSSYPAHCFWFTCTAGARLMGTVFLWRNNTKDQFWSEDICLRIMFHNVLQDHTLAQSSLHIKMN